MKFFLLLLLLVAITSKDVIEIIECLSKKGAVQELVMRIISVIYLKDYKKIIEILLSSITPVYKAVMECI